MTTNFTGTKDLAVGDRLPEVAHGPISRGDLALFAGASGDHVLLHIDSDFARSAGMEDVFAHGMLSMAYLAQVFTGSFRLDQLVDWSVRFLSITPLYATVHSRAEVTELLDIEGKPYARFSIDSRTGDGQATLEGTALVCLD